MRNSSFGNVLNAMLLASCSFASTGIGTASANANAIVVPATGCGTGCLIYQKQLGVPYQDKRGLRKVLVEQTYKLYSVAGSYGGKDRTEIRRTFFLAECSRRKANFTSHSSNGTGEDDIFRWIDVPYGNEGTRESGPDWATFVQYDRICALRLPQK